MQLDKAKDTSNGFASSGREILAFQLSVQGNIGLV